MSVPDPKLTLVASIYNSNHSTLGTSSVRKLLAMLLAMISFNALADTTINTPAFKLELGDGWKQEQSSDPEQFSYYSAQRDIGITASFMFVKVKLANTERMANKLKELRLAGEDAAASKFGLTMTIAEPIVVPYGEGYQVAYYGHDSANRQFRYLGIVTATKIVNIYTESKGRSQQELEDAFNRVLKGLTISK